MGQIVNLMSTDAQTLQEVLPSLNMIWSMPFQILLALYFLTSELGASVFSGVAILVLLIPFNIATGKMTRKIQSEQSAAKDKRIKAMYEILNSIKIIKLNAWEESFQVNISYAKSNLGGSCRDKGSASRSGGHEIESRLGKSQSLGCFLFNQLEYCLGIARTLNHDIIIIIITSKTHRLCRSLWG